MIGFKLSKGQIICFSGHHLHGSMIGAKARINLETRIVSRGDEKQYDIPRNIDSMSRVKQNRWFKNIKTEEFFV